MKKVLGVVILALVLVQIITLQSKATSIAVVNMRTILKQSIEGKNTKTEIQNLIEAKKIIIQKKTKQLREIINKLKSKNLTKEEKKKLQKEYEKRLIGLQKYQESASQEVRNKEIQKTDKILTEAINIIKKYAKTHNIDIVLETSQGSVIYWNNKLDITNKIIKMMNQKQANPKK